MPQGLRYLDERIHMGLEVGEGPRKRGAQRHSLLGLQQTMLFKVLAHLKVH